MSRLFTDAELQEMIVPTTTRIRDAYKAGDKETATKLWNKLVDDYMYAFDLRVDWDKAFTDYIYNNLGGDALYEVWKYRGWTEDEIRPMKITEEVRAEGKKMIEAGDDYDAFDKFLNREYFKFRHSHDKRIEWETRIMGYVLQPSSINNTKCRTMSRVINCAHRMSQLMRSILSIVSQVQRGITCQAGCNHQLGAVYQIITLGVKDNGCKICMDIVHNRLKEIGVKAKVSIWSQIAICVVSHHIPNTVAQQIARKRHRILRIHESIVRLCSHIPRPILLSCFLIAHNGSCTAVSAGCGISYNCRDRSNLNICGNCVCFFPQLPQFAFVCHALGNTLC